MSLVCRPASEQTTGCDARKGKKKRNLEKEEVAISPMSRTHRVAIIRQCQMRYNTKGQSTQWSFPGPIVSRIFWLEEKKKKPSFASDFLGWRQSSNLMDELDDKEWNFWTVATVFCWCLAGKNGLKSAIVELFWCFGFGLVWGNCPYQNYLW